MNKPVWWGTPRLPPETSIVHPGIFDRLSSADELWTREGVWDDGRWASNKVLIRGRSRAGCGVPYLWVLLSANERMEARQFP